MNLWRTAAFGGMFVAAAASGASVEEDWAAVTALDAGPQSQPRTGAEARAAALGHLERQEKALRTFLAAHAQTEHSFEAELRLARLLDIRAGFAGSERARAEAGRLLDALEKTATPEQRAEVDFARVTRLMRGAKVSPAAQRAQLLSATRRFQTGHPSDRRVAALLAEVATLFTDQPAVMTMLLNDANATAGDPGLKSRIADDLCRLGLLGQAVPLAFTSLQGTELKTADFAGKPLLLVFFAEFSPPSADAIARVQRAISELPAGSVNVVGVSLDAAREPLDALRAQMKITWPIAFDSKSWEGALVRSLGINALPTVWLLDQQGRLRSLNALEGTAEQTRHLLRE